MKKFLAFIFIIFLGMNLTLFSKEKLNIIGIWQLNTTVLAAAYVDTFVFFEDGTFIFYFNHFDDDSEVKSLHGKYKLNNDILTIQVLSKKMKKNGIYRLGNSNNEDTKTWVYDSKNDNYKVTVPFKQKDSSIITIPLKQKAEKVKIKLQMKKKNMVLTINGFKYYLVDRNPKEID